MCGNALYAFSIPKAIERQSMNFENAAREQALNSELPDFMREAYMFGLTETSKRDQANVILQLSMVDREMKNYVQPPTP